MPYITREDGARFVIPSYRDVITAKQKGALKKEIVLLSQSYGEYITLQEKAANQYEVAFSPDTGYLLGETVWHYFNRPLDMIYCEAIPNSTEAILVIVKAGSVYLDGSFPLDSISEELIIFLTQQNNFEIFVSGNVPISQEPTEGKFSFEANSVKSFTVLDEPAFAKLPLLKIYQLQLVDTVLKAHGIGVFPVRQLLLGIIILGLLYFGYDYITSHREVVQPFVQQAPSPYLGYYSALQSPDPVSEINHVLAIIQKVISVPGWNQNNGTYAAGNFNMTMLSNGGTVEDLIKWANQNGMSIDIKNNGISLNATITLPKRNMPTKIYALKDIIATLIDKIAIVTPGNLLQLGTFNTHQVYTDVNVTVTLTSLTPGVWSLVASTFKDLPLVLTGMTFTLTNGVLSGTITLQALGS